MARQAGFTLIEISIVLVIVGLLLGGVLKGQELINNARIKRINSDMNGVSSAVYSYLDRYNAIPGDDPNALGRWGASSATTVVSGNGSGIIDGGDIFADSTDENIQLWHHLRLSNLMAGDAATLPVHAFGGNVGVADGMFAISGPTVCMAGIPDKFVEIIDIQLDDGNPATGTLRASTLAIPTTAGPTGYPDYSDAGASLSLCRQI